MCLSLVGHDFFFCVIMSRHISKTVCSVRPSPLVRRRGRSERRGRRGSRRRSKEEKRGLNRKNHPKRKTFRGKDGKKLNTIEGRKNEKKGTRRDRQIKNI